MLNFYNLYLVDSSFLNRTTKYNSYFVHTSLFNFLGRKQNGYDFFPRCAYDTCRAQSVQGDHVRPSLLFLDFGPDGRNDFLANLERPGGLSLGSGSA